MLIVLEIYIVIDEEYRHIMSFKCEPDTNEIPDYLDPVFIMLNCLIHVT